MVAVCGKMKCVTAKYKSRNDKDEEDIGSDPALTVRIIYNRLYRHRNIGQFVTGIPALRTIFTRYTAVQK